jgi:hypothetical protein
MISAKYLTVNEKNWCKHKWGLFPSCLFYLNQTVLLTACFQWKHSGKVVFIFSSKTRVLVWCGLKQAKNELNTTHVSDSHLSLVENDCFQKRVYLACFQAENDLYINSGTDLNLGSQGCHHKKIPWFWTQDPCMNSKYLVTGPSQQDITVLHKSILVPFRTTKDSFLAVTFTGLADLFPQLGSWHVQLCGDFKNLALVVQCQNTWYCCSGPGFESCLWSLMFFHADILGRLGSNLVFIVPFGTSYVEFGAELWLVPFGIM